VPEADALGIAHLALVVDPPSGLVTLNEEVASHQLSV
jgi:hypothetical protein